jgi:hypothetical protein
MPSSWMDSSTDASSALTSIFTTEAWACFAAFVSASQVM